MPELPEVETVVRGLQPHIIGQQITGVDILLAKTVWLDDVRATGPTEIEQFIIAVRGKTIDAITRRGKMILMGLSGGLVLLIHLKMTGQLVYVGPDRDRVSGGHPSPDLVKQLPVKSTRATFHFQNQASLYFNDQRQFGYLKLITQQSLATHHAYQSYGPEPFDDFLTADYLLAKASRRPKLTIKQFILDQTVIAGVGNIYADEALFASRIYPGTKAGSLTKGQMSNLLSNIRKVLDLGIRYGGTSSEHFVKASGEKGAMQDHLLVYRRTGQPCPNCGSPIFRMVIAGRGTHYCPQCQKDSHEANK